MVNSPILCETIAGVVLHIGELFLLARVAKLVYEIEKAPLQQDDNAPMVVGWCTWNDNLSRGSTIFSILTDSEYKKYE
jgi:hypothetical protein